MTDKARALKAAGRDVIGLGAGEPDFDTPDNIKEAAISAIRDGKTKYTDVDGIPRAEGRDLRASSSARTGSTYKRNQINVSPGGKQVLFNVLHGDARSRRRGDHPGAVLGELPGHGAVCGRRRRSSSRPDGGWLQDAARGAAKGDHAEDQWVILNSPSNPTGAAYSADELKALAAVLVRHPHVW